MMFEELYEFAKDEIPILVVDLRVSLFSLLYRAKRYEINWSMEDLMHFWQQKLHYPLINFPKQEFQLVIVDDTKYSDGTYWRTRYLKNLPKDFPIYKGNRKPEERPELYYKLHEAGVKYAKTNKIHYLAKRGFEADDFAGAICQEVLKNEGIGRPVILYTVDSDWGQLVSDKYRILFYYSNLPVWKHKLRDEKIIRQWFLERQSTELHSVRDIVQAKVDFGDKSDNLEVGSPAGVIDLLNPTINLPKKYHLEIQKILTTPCRNSLPRKYVMSTIHLNKKIYDFIKCSKSKAIL
ncbi:MAG: hypothetical protein QNJ16_19695 [Rhodobacter sp.]|nr:hypothetical protein [Rhodobacter sp.]